MNSNIRFRCTNYSFNVTIIANDKLNEIIEAKKFPHNHPPLKDNSIKLDIIRTSVKRKGTEDQHTKPNTIILKKIRQSRFGTDIEYSSLRLVRKLLYCACKKLFPTLPQTLEDTIDILSAEGDNITTFNDEKFCHISSGKNLILFTCKANLNLLCDSTHVFGDGTFRYAPNFFLQLYTIHVYVNTFYIPVIYCLLPFKNLEMYQYM
ncbi:MULE domain-containing protein [Aphis craccivora]|uniref:MULE domain-containing protein n=1 Tax=Aphis craccivora TaxID=307492 RepID=A0A6G0VM06_APHCR|nr:MULE domain-containing protein [Aphis craccivora]